MDFNIAAAPIDKHCKEAEGRNPNLKQPTSNQGSPFVGV